MYTLSYIATHVDNNLPSSSYSPSPIYSEHVNTQLVYNKQWYVQRTKFTDVVVM